MRRIKYAQDELDSLGNRTGNFEWIEGIFHDFTSDFEYVVIVTSDGAVHKVEYPRCCFIDYAMETDW